MDPIALLTDEHRLIRHALDALEHYADALTLGRDVVPGDLERFVTFIRVFADERHHGKEENILFDTMVEQGFPREGGPIAVMLAEHDQNRVLTRAMAEGIGREAQWSDAERTKVANAARAYVELLRQHIWKEDNVLYPMAANHLQPGAFEHVAAECERFERSRRDDERAQFEAVVGQLSERYSAY